MAALVFQSLVKKAKRTLGTYKLRSIIKLKTVQDSIGTVTLLMLLDYLLLSIMLNIGQELSKLPPKTLHTYIQGRKQETGNAHLPVSNMTGLLLWYEKATLHANFKATDFNSCVPAFWARCIAKSFCSHLHVTVKAELKGKGKGT